METLGGALCRRRRHPLRQLACDLGRRDAGVFMSFLSPRCSSPTIGQAFARVHVELAGNLVDAQMMYDFLAEPVLEKSR